MTVRTVTVVVRPLIRGNAIVHVVFVPESVQKAPQKKAGKMCRERVLTHQPWRGDDVNVAERQPTLLIASRKPFPEPEEQHADVLQVISEPHFSWTNCSNFHHFDIQNGYNSQYEQQQCFSFTLTFKAEIKTFWRPAKRLIVSPAVCPLLLEIFTMLTFRVQRRNQHRVNTISDHRIKNKDREARRPRANSNLP